ncbi:hypothetical protein E2320_009369 [Naja naja]|nr:hypothetical protein E2320_009369 [Naja naja]
MQAEGLGRPSALCCLPQRPSRPLLQLIQTISVVDRDDPPSGHRFYFTLGPEAIGSRHFSLLGITDDTAGLHTQHLGFNRQEQDLFLLPILVVDSGPRPQQHGHPHLLVLLILALKRHQKGHLPSEEDEDMRDNVIKYNDEGGGEQDTQAYDMSALRSLYEFGETKGGEEKGAPPPPSELHSLPQWRQAPDLDFSLFRDYIRRKVGQADGDPSVPPYDSFQTYAFEGADSPLASLSSIASRSTGSEQDFSYLGAWGPRFRQLAMLYAGTRAEEGSRET